MAELLTQESNAKAAESRVDGLVAYLRAHPYKLDHSKHELAEQFGLDETFVGNVLDTLRGSPNKLARTESIARALTLSYRSVATSVTNIYEEFTERPVVSLFVTLVLTVSVMLLLRHAGIIGALPVPADQVESTLQTAALMLGATLAVLHGLVYFRHGMMRYVFYGAGIVLVVTFATLMYVLGGQPLRLGNDQEIVGISETTPFLVFASVIIASFYMLFSGVVSLAGGYWRTSQVDKQQRRLTRQELIDRLFTLQERLRDESFDFEARERLTVAGWMRITPCIPLVGLAAGFLTGLTTVVFRVVVAVGPAAGSIAPQLPSGAELVPRVVTAVAFFVVGFLSGGVRRAIVALVMMFAGTLLAESLPLRYFGPQYIEMLRTTGLMFEGLVNTLVLALLVGMGGHIERRARVRQKLQDNDPAHVTAEIVEIQWRLNPSTGSSSTMVVDVAGSTRMKAEADPLAVEYSFRAYQEFVASIIQKRGGTVLSTAGDGVVASFPSCGEALYAAKELQTRIGEFNTRSNRLASQFRVRIGIHTGSVSAQLQEVPFNEVIDIAAHVEKQAPVGGIAVTQRVVEDLAEEKVAALKDQIDGHNVYVVINPTLIS